MMGCKLYVLLCATFLIKGAQSTSPNGGRDSQKAVDLPPCQACSIFIDSLRRAREEVTKELDKDLALDMQSVLPYVCLDVSHGQDQCYALLDQHTADIENHWTSEDSVLFSKLCIDSLKVCCPPDHYGPKCEKCHECHENGKCTGAGTRKGNGKCSCNPGYTGDGCRECSVSYYETFRDETKLLCSRCHDACGADGCTTGGPNGCLSCKTGWRMDSNNSCSDANECLETKNICSQQQFCVNNDGSYTCLDCDKSCIGCEGDGPDMCKFCAEGYTIFEGKCTDDTWEKLEQYVNLNRLLTYFGLCTCVAFQSSTTKAYMMGGAVATYIAASEYWPNTIPTPANRI